MRVRPFRIALVAMSMIAGLLAAGASAPTDSAEASQSYIVVFDDAVTEVGAEAARLSSNHGGTLGFVYEHALKGFSVEISARGAAAIARNPRVAYVESDPIVTIAAQTVPTGIERIFTDENPNVSIDETNDAIDVDVAVIDTGIDLDHPDLHVVASTNCSGGSPFKQSCDSGGDDDNGHGTHVAGTIGALDNDTGVAGVAPGARLWSVKVLRSDGSGYLSWIIAGIDHVTANANHIEVANMSLGGSFSNQSFDDAIANSVSAGVAYAVAAGNSDSDASGFSPANHPDVLTVSALADFDGQPGALITNTDPYCRDDEDDTLANFSNWGSLVDIAAPGVCILSTWLNGGYNTISGTSMASPHAAGALGLLAVSNNPSNETDVKALYKALTDTGNFCWTDDSGDGIQEPLLDLRDPTVSRSCDGDADAPPSVSITNPEDGATVSGTSVTVSVDASDDGNVTQVEFFVDDNSIGVDSDGADGWSASWDSTTVADGQHTVTAEATDDAAQTASHSITVTVDNVDDPPSVSITNPEDGATVAGTVTVTADATDDDTVTQVEFFVDGNSIGVDSDGADGWSASWDTTTYSDSSHTIEAKATDSGSQTASDLITVTVDNASGGEITLTSESINDGPTWTAVVTSSGDTLEGTWNYSDSGTTASCAGNECSLSGIPKRVGSVVFTASTGEEITVTKP